MILTTWEKRIAYYEAGGRISNSLINRLRSIFNVSFMTEAKPEQALLEEVALYQYGHGPGWQIEQEQTEKGLKWLRLPCNHKHLPVAALKMIEDFSHFTFEGVLLNWTGLRQEAAVVYRLHAKDGSYFDYSAYWWNAKSADRTHIHHTYTKGGAQ
jgi:hypothetical protein